MRGVGKEAIIIAQKHKDLAQIAYRLFSEKGIDNVSLQEIADNSNYGIATLYRYFTNKQTLVVAAAVCKWEEYLDENQKRRPLSDFVGITAAEIFDFYLDSFIDLYRNHRDLLRFNQHFNVYIQKENTDQKTLEPYRKLIEGLKVRFDIMYQKGRSDHTIKTDVQEEEMFSVTLHLMLSAVTRYAVGLAYMPEGFDAISELTFLKEMLHDRYCTGER